MQHKNMTLYRKCYGDEKTVISSLRREPDFVSSLGRDSHGIGNSFLIFKYNKCSVEK